ncbi:AEC family transporter [Anaerosinus massiliensis]|uniref:AEC family transporter n=1 Tax=Massilibacillus massiliensis TaxID=1806837 RepID=UPI0018FF09A3|nr:AEC family transporter [Massilibacillus massiliensis]
MNDVLLNALSLITMIIIGYHLKKYNFVTLEGRKLITDIIMMVTLPCALISGFSDFKMDASLYYVILVSLSFNVIVCLFALIWSHREHNEVKAFNVLNMPGYNIGCFTLPFVQTSLGPFGVIVTSMFDIGNSIMCTGVNYALAAEIAGKGEQNKIRNFIKKMLSSIPFDVYMVMLFITITGIQLPHFVFYITSHIGSANAFLCMLLIGMLFEYKLERYQLVHVITILSVRLLSAAIFAFIIYYYTSFSLAIKQVVILTTFSPIPISTTIFTERCGADVKLSGICSSFAIPISLIIMTSLLTYWNL